MSYDENAILQAAESGKPVVEFLQRTGTGFPDKTLVAARDLLADPMPQHDILEKVHKVYSELHKVMPDGPDWDRLRGILGFFTFCHSAEHSQATPDGHDCPAKNTLSSPNAYLEDPAVIAFLLNDYTAIKQGLRESIVRHPITLHRTGTTSYILRIKGIKKVLKVIKPKYAKNQTITRHTAQYDSSGIEGNVPTVDDSGNTFILMDYISGPTLREFLDGFVITGQGWRTTRPDKWARCVSGILMSLCDELRTQALNGIVHSDLSPDNIILHGADSIAGGVDSDEHTTVYLIDFGRNYLLSERVGTTEAFAQAQVYIAPELMLPGECPTILSDLYSLGMIFLEMAGPKKLMPHELGQHWDRAWSHYPELCGVIEDMIERNPGHRVHDVLTSMARRVLGDSAMASSYGIQPACVELMRRGSGPDADTDAVVRQLRSAFRRELLRQAGEYTILEDADRAASLRALQAGVYDRVKATIRTHLESYRRVVLLWQQGVPISFRILAAPITSSYATVFQLAKEAVVAEDVRDIGNVQRSSYLWGWARCALVCHLANCLLPMILIVGGIGMFRFGNDVPVLSALVGMRWEAKLPAWIVAVSFSFAALRYYLNVLSTLDFRAVSKFAEVCVRMNAFSFAPPILVAVLVPRYWPICSAVGVLCAFMSNLAIYRIARSAVGGLKEGTETALSIGISEFLREIRGWPVANAFYGVCLVLIGCLLLRGDAKDEWVYAIVVAAVNVLVIFFNSCTRNAGKVRGGILRLVTALRRSREGQGG